MHPAYHLRRVGRQAATPRAQHSAALLGNEGLIGELKKRLAERILLAEMDSPLDDEEQQAAG